MGFNLTLVQFIIIRKTFSVKCTQTPMSGPLSLLISDAAIKTWVNAAVQAALPPVMAETRSIFREAMKEHEKILLMVTQQHLEVMTEQGRAMNKVMQQMNKLIAVGGTTLLLVEYLKTNVSLIPSDFIF